MNIKESYKRFKQWQKSPVAFKMSDERHRCQNCGEEFEGNFCPCCGQRGGTGVVTWRSIHEGVMELWGIGTRSMPYTLWQLLLRPGYFIGEYISGRKQVSFPPVKMLVIVATLIFVIDHLTGLQLFGPEDAVTDTAQDNIFEKISDWLSNHYDWSSLLFFLFLLFPTNIVFRYSPRHALHTVPQGFFVQVFNSTLFLLLVFIVGVLLWVLGLQTSSSVNDVLFYIIIGLQLIVVYKQLFGFGLWATIWRISLTVILSIFLFLTVAFLVDLCSGSIFIETNDGMGGDIFITLSALVAFLLTTECYKAAFYDRPVQTRWQRVKENALLVFLVLNIIMHLLFVYAIYFRTLGADEEESVEKRFEFIEVLVFALVVLIVLTYGLIRKKIQRRKQKLHPAASAAEPVPEEETTIRIES